MVSSKMIFVHRQHPLQHLGRFLVFAEQPVRQCQIVKEDRNLNATVPIVLHEDIEGAFEEVLGLVVVLELSVGCGQVRERLRHHEVFLAIVPLFHLHDPLEDVLRLLEVPEIKEGDAKVHQRPGQQDVLLSSIILKNIQRAFEELVLRPVVSEPHVCDCQIVQSVPHSPMMLIEMFLPDRQGLLQHLLVGAGVLHTTLKTAQVLQDVSVQQRVYGERRLFETVLSACGQVPGDTDRFLMNLSLLPVFLLLRELLGGF